MVAKLFLLTLLTFTANCNVIPPQGQGSTFTPAEQALLNIYGNFTSGIGKALVDNDIAMQSGSQGHAGGHDICAPPEGIQATSAFGLGQILAILNQNVWKASVPVFEQILVTTPATLPDAFEFIFKKFLQNSDTTFTSGIFTSDAVSVTPALTKLKTEVKSTDLTQASAKDTINAYVTKFIGQPLTQDYIPKEASISPAAKAVLVDALRISETWDSPVTKVTSPPKFNGVDTVEMIEMKGAFQVLESDNAIEVIVPFQNKQRAISLVLPSNIATIFNDNLVEPKLANYPSVRVQIPVLKSSIRNYEAALTNQCNFKKEDNFFQLLDHVIQVSLDQQKFETVSITGAQINDVKKFKTIPSTTTKPPAPCSEANAAVPPPAPPAAAAPSGSEKLITFSRSFTWTLLDKDLGPIMAGTVFSVKGQPKVAPSTSFVFGQETELGYSKCL